MKKDFPSTSPPECTPHPWGKDIFGFGMSLGAILGLLSATISLRMSYELGKPNAFIREGWDYFHVAMMIIIGGLAGMGYGLILTVTAQAHNKKVPRKSLFSFTLLLAIVVYPLMDYVAVIHGNCDFSMYGHPVVFLGSLVIAFFLIHKQR